MLCQLPVFALQFCCLNFCGHGLLAVVSRFERLADAMAAEAKATAKAAAKPKAKGKAQAGSVCIFDAWSGCHFGVMKSSSFWLRYRRPLQWTFQCSRVDSEAASEQVAVVANHVLSQTQCKPRVNPCRLSASSSTCVMVAPQGQPPSMHAVEFPKARVCMLSLAMFLGTLLSPASLLALGCRRLMLLT